MDRELVRSCSPPSRTAVYRAQAARRARDMPPRSPHASTCRTCFGSFCGHLRKEIAHPCRRKPFLTKNGKLTQSHPSIYLLARHGFSTDNRRPLCVWPHSSSAYEYERVCSSIVAATSFAHVTCFFLQARQVPGTNSKPLGDKQRWDDSRQRTIEETRRTYASIRRASI